MIFKEKRAPFLRLLPPFCVGIILHWLATPSGILMAAITIMALILLFISTLQITRKKRRLKWLGTTSTFLLIAGTGALLCRSSDIRNNRTWIGDKEFSGIFILQADEPPLHKTASWKIPCSIIAVRDPGSNQFLTASGKLIAYLKAEDSLQLPVYGQRFVISGSLTGIHASGNPGGFDYKSWCEKKGIFHQINTSVSATVHLPGFYGNPLMSRLYKLRNKLLLHLRANIRDPSAIGIAEALLIGYRYGIDAELNEAYTKTGVVHIVAISGMHLSMIFSLLALLPFRKKNRKMYLLRNILIGLVIWLFTLLAGAAPSILRAAVMLSLVLLAQAIPRRSTPVNTLLASAFILLVADPMCLWDIGFQLSYTAVGGLVLFARPLEALFTFKHPFLTMLWQMQAISIAAQVLTTPLVIYHFHQFPLLFLLTNMVAVPVSGIVLYIELALCLFICWPFAAAVTGQLVTTLLLYMNSYILLLAKVPWCNADHLNINLLQVSLLYVSISFIVLFFRKRNRLSLYGFLLSTLTFIGIRRYEISKALQQRLLILYQVPGYSYGEIIVGRCAIKLPSAADLATGQADKLRSDTTILTERMRGKYIYPTHVYFRINETRAFSPGDHALLAGLIPEKILIIVPGARLPEPGHASTSPACLVLDGTISGQEAARWKRAAAGAEIPVHEIRRNGAFVIPLN